ncbi:DUF748 domain-containing protein [Thalassomonas viridans]|uniref:DUF748 domain-containing protein n=1 Tax=Thalassomonas viridans TaxID=137584 RepID=A0AAE9YZC8_9GAMM|nr:DUF748 domain-containing protein [Thalassomonas viridans]WDE03775.1 DUF748 domain-containing protein [Thalassomonas viridans]
MRTIAIKITKIILLLFLGLYCLIWLLSPAASRYFIADMLVPQNLVLSDDTSIRYNPFLSKLSVSNLTLHPAADREKQLFRLDSLVVRIRLYQLLFDRIHINEFNLDGLFLDISQKGDSFEVAGFAVPAADKAGEDGEQEQEKEFPYTLELPALKVKNSTLAVNLPQGQHELVIDSLELADVEATANRQDFSVALNAKVNQAPLTLGLDGIIRQETAAIEADLALEDFDLTRLSPWLPEGIFLHSGVLDYRTNLHVQSNKKDKLKLDFKETGLVIDTLHLEQEQTHFTLSKQLLESKALDLALVFGAPEGSLPVIKGDANLVLTDARGYHREAQNQLMAFETLKLDNILLAVTENIPALRMDEITLTGASFSDFTDNELPAIARISSLAVKEVQASPGGLSINKIGLGSFELDLSLDENKNLENLVKLSSAQAVEEAPGPEKQVQGKEKAAQQSAAPGQDFALVMNEFVLEQDSHIRFTDRSVKPAYKRDFIISTLEAGPVNNQQPETRTAFKLTGKSNKYAKFDLSGYTSPFLPEPVYKLSGGFREISLPAISAYIKDALQHELQSGQLDLGVDVTLTGEEIDGHTDILLRGIELTSADDHQVDSLKDQTAIPFNVALGMLKDSDGNVELDIPLSGNTSDPSFGFSGFLTLLTKQAVMRATREYLMTTFVPYANVVSITLSAGEYLLKVRFNDLLLSPGVSEFAQDHTAFFNEFATLMKDKPDTRVTLCAVATAQDIGLPVGTEELTEAELRTLNELSLKRLNHFKSYMVEQEQIDSSRLLLCNPQVDLSSEARPRLTFAT